MGAETRYVLGARVQNGQTKSASPWIEETHPEGKNTRAGVRVEDWHVPSPQRLPSEIAALIAAVSSVVPSPLAP